MDAQIQTATSSPAHDGGSVGGGAQAFLLPTTIPPPQIPTIVNTNVVNTNNINSSNGGSNSKSNENNSVGDGNPSASLKLNDVFDTIELAKKQILRYILDRGESFKVHKSNSNRAYVVICKEPECSFRIRATLKSTGRAQITVLRNHVCGMAVHQNFRHSHSVRTIQSNAVPLLTTAGNLKPKQLQRYELFEHGLNVSYLQAWRAIEHSRKNLSNSDEQCFRKFISYAEHIKNAMEGNYAIVETNEQKRFHRMFVAPNATRNAFQHCRKIIPLACKELESRFRLALMIGAVIDGNDNLLPICWALVPANDAENWTFFLKHLALSMGNLENESVVFISNYQNELVNEIHSSFPNAKYCHCCHSIADTLMNKYGSVSRNLFWKAANACTQIEFEAIIKEIKSNSATAHDYTSTFPVHEWAVHAVQSPRYGQLTANLFDAFQTGADSLTPLHAMFSIYNFTMQMFYGRRNEKQSLSLTVTDNCKRKLDAVYQLSRKLEVLGASTGIGLIKNAAGQSFKVDLLNRMCSCNEMQEYAIPCAHALALCLKQGLDPMEYVSKCYAIEEYDSTYGIALLPIALEELTEDECYAPKIKIAAPGKPRRPRIKEGPVRTLKCSSCGGESHNRRSCTNS